MNTEQCAEFRIRVEIDRIRTGINDRPQDKNPDPYTKNESGSDVANNYMRNSYIDYGSLGWPAYISVENLSLFHLTTKIHYFLVIY